jgi:HK97 family phage major capsid protein
MKDKPIPLRFDLDDARDAVREAAMTSLARAAICAGLAVVEKTRAEQVARRAYGGDRTLDLILRAPVSPTSVAGTPALATVATAFIETLVPVSAGADLLTRAIGLNFAGAASISFPAISPAIVVDFVGESQPYPVRQGVTSAGPTLTAHKLGGVVALTNEMIRNSNAETIVRNTLVEATGPGLDKVLFSTTAAASDRPAGLLNGITPLTPSTGGTGTNKTQAIVDDLQTLATAIAPVAGNGDIVLVASPDAAVALVLRLPASVDWPVLTSASLAARTVIAVAAKAIVAAIDGAPTIDAKQEVGAHFADPASEIVDVGGIRATPVYSTFQKDEVALRLRWPISWVLRTPTGISWMQNVNW